MNKAAVDFLDLRDVIDDPIEALERGEGRRALIQVPLEKVRNLGPLAFPLTRDAGEPFVTAIQDYLNGDQKSYRGSWLEWFYARWTPANAAALLGLPDGATPWAASPVHAFVYPWKAADPETRQHRKLESMRQENRLKGAEISGLEGYVWAGPMSQRKGEFELRRLRLLGDSIKTYGFETDCPEIGNIRGEVLVRDSEWRIMGTTGNHRRSVLAALGWSHAPIEVKGKVIRRDNAAGWPGVRKGLFSLDQALEIFDRIFEGRQPAGCPSIREAKQNGSLRSREAV